MKHILLFSLVFFWLPPANGQQKLKGRFDSKTQQFITSNEEYHIDFFQENVARIYKAGYVGLINKNGEILVQPKYDQIYDFEGELAKFSIHKKNGLINREGEVILEPFFGEIEDFQNGFAKCKIDYLDSRIINAKGEFINKHAYDFIGAQYQDHFPFIRENKMGLLTTDGEEIVVIPDYNEQKYSRLVNYFHLGASIVVDGKEISPLFKFTDDRALTFAKVGEEIKFGCIDPNGKVVVPIEFDQIEPFKDGVAAAKKGELWGIIDQSGKTIIPFEHELITVADHRHFVITKNGSYGIIGENGLKIAPTRYASIATTPESHFIVSKNGKFGLLDSEGTSKLDLKYPFLTYLLNGLYITHNEKKWGVINDSGKSVLPFKYDGIRRQNDSTGIASKHISSFSLNTGVPRFSYTGMYFSFNRSGLLSKNGNTFSKVIEMRGDFYNESSVIQYGPSTLTPMIVGELPSTSKIEPLDFQVVRILPNGFKLVHSTSRSLERSVEVLPHAVLGSPKSTYKWGIVNEKNEFVVPMEYDEITVGSSTNRYYGINASVPKNVFVAKKGKLYGAINLKNEVIVPFEQYTVQLLPAMIFLMKVKTEQVEDRWGDVYSEEEYSASIVDFNGKVIVPFEPDTGADVVEEWFNDESRAPLDMER